MEVLQRTANRGSISTGSYDIDNSCKFEADNSEVMTHTYDSAPTSQKKMTISMWYKRTEVSSNIGIIEFGDDSSGDYFQIRWGRDIYGSLETYGMRFGSTNFSVGNTYGAVRDTSAWYHIVVAIDTTQGTASNRFKVYRNGAELDWSTDNRATITQNQDLALGENGKRVVIGEGAYKYNGYIAEVNYVDGQQLSSTDFGEYDEDSGIWKPKAYTGTYGNNGFYLDFSNASDLGEDQSGNNHDFSLTNISAADQATDTPTNNFCTLNPLMISNRVTITNGGTSIISAGVDGNSTTTTMGVSNGKWYWEFYMTSNGGTAYWPSVGYTTDPSQPPDETAGNSGTSSKVALLPNGGTFVTGTIAGGKFNTFSANDIAGFALDMDNGNMYIYKNGTIQNSGNAIFTSIGDFAMPVIDTSADAPAGGYFNFGGYAVNTISSAATDANGYGTFEYAPPTGYYALCTKNLAEYG